MASASRSLPNDWQDKTIIGLSILLIVSPWLAGYADAAGAKWNAIILGAMLAAGAAAVLLWEPYWPDFVTAFMAFWLAVSPRILAFTDDLAATIVASVTGIGVIVLALWAAVARARAIYFATHPAAVGIDPPVTPPGAPQRPRKAA